MSLDSVRIGINFSFAQLTLLHQRLQKRIPGILVKLDINLGGHVIGHVVELAPGSNGHQQHDIAPVYPREVVKLALERNAAAIIMTHNHPSGDPTPSQADIELTKQLQKALSLVDVRVLDHIVVGMEGCESLAEKGLL